MKVKFLVLAMVLGLMCVSASADTIDTFAGWSQSLYISSLGEPNAAAFGQTFRLNPGDDNVLDSITFYLFDDLPHGGHTDDVNFALYLYEWDGNKLTGDALFAGSQLTTTHGQPTFEAFSVNTNGVELMVGTDYVWFLSTLLFFDGAPDGTLVAQVIDPLTSAGPYPNGHFVFFQFADDFNTLSKSRAIVCISFEHSAR